MALASTTILRRAASSSLLPRRSLLAATSATVRSSLVVPLSRFSTSSSDVASRISNKDLVRMLDVQIEQYSKKTAPRVPPEFPFVIQSTEWENMIFLSRRYEDEIIKLEVYEKEDEDEDEDEEEDDEEQEDQDEEEKEKKNEDEDEDEDSVTRNFFRVTITKESCNREMVFEIWAYKDRITIQHLFVKNELRGRITHRQLPIFFSKLNEETKEDFYKYLDMRGINLANANTLLAAWEPDDHDISLEREKWLENLKDFLAG